MGREVVVSGYAKMPEGTGARAVYETLTISVAVDRETHVVQRADSTLITEIGRTWINENLVGVDLFEDPSPFLDAVERDFWGQSKSALAQGFRDLARRYASNVQREDAAAGGS